MMIKLPLFAKLRASLNNSGFEFEFSDRNLSNKDKDIFKGWGGGLYNTIDLLLLSNI